MGPLPLWTRFRQWLAIRVLLRVTWFVLGSKPLFCDMAEAGCPLDEHHHLTVDDDDNLGDESWY